MEKTKMFQKIANWQDKKLLAKYQKCDTELGVPTVKTLNERCAKAAGKGYWLVCFDSLDKGAEINEVMVDMSREWAGRLLHWPLTFLAVDQKRLDILEELMKRGADSLSGSSSNHKSIFLLQHAVEKQSPESLAIILKGDVRHHSAVTLAACVAVKKNDAACLSLLLASGEGDLEECLRDAQVKNRTALIKLIRAEQKKRQEQAPPATTPQPAVMTSPAPESIAVDFSELASKMGELQARVERIENPPVVQLDKPKKKSLGL
jgi:hypothetical protein